MGNIIERERSVIPALDVGIDDLIDILEKTADIDEIGAYKLGFRAVFDQALPSMSIAPGTVYNHGFGANDIPATSKPFFDSLVQNENIAGVVLTPLSGPETMEAWIDKAHSERLDVYVEIPLITEDSYLTEDAMEKIIQIAERKFVRGVIFHEDQHKKSIPFEIEVYTRSKGGTVNWDDQTELSSLDVLEVGLPKIVELAKAIAPDKALIYDHQKWTGTNPDRYLGIMDRSGIDAAIIFPQYDREIQEDAIKVAQARQFPLICGGLMTHPGFLASEGGFIRDNAYMEMYEVAARLGVQDYVVPGNKPDEITAIRTKLEELGVTPTFYAPGFIDQGGNIGDGAKAAGERFHAIIGGAIYKEADRKAAALKVTSQIKK